MDNARIHHSYEILELVDRFGRLTLFISSVLKLNSFVGVRIEYLLPYSPDLNQIEEAFSKIKHFLHRHQDYYLAATGDGIIYDMYEVMEIITSDDAAGYYMHAGYF